MNSKVPMTMDRALVTYHAMSDAIDKFYNVDDCKEIVDQTVGFTAYYKQAKNVEMERKFIGVRLRAWRRMAEIIGNVIKDLKPERYIHQGSYVMGVTPSRMMKKIRDTLGEKTIKDMTETRMMELIKLSKISNKDFEETMKSLKLTGSLFDFFRHTPEAIARAEDAYDKQVARLNSPEHKAQVAREEAEWSARQRENNEQYTFKQELEAAAEEALSEVGVTLERRDRMKMVKTLFLHNVAVHELMRLIAYQESAKTGKHVTMHDILRRGLRMYAEHLGHKWPVEIKEKETADAT